MSTRRYRGVPAAVVEYNMYIQCFIYKTFWHDVVLFQLRSYIYCYNEIFLLLNMWLFIWQKEHNWLLYLFLHQSFRCESLIESQHKKLVPLCWTWKRYIFQLIVSGIFSSDSIKFFFFFEEYIQERRVGKWKSSE